MDLVVQYINKYKYKYKYYELVDYMESSSGKYLMKIILSLISESGCPLVFHINQKRNIKQ
jgi:hypothetical protein